MITQTGITLWHKSVDPAKRLHTWAATLYPNVSWQEDVKMSLLANGVQSANVVKIRIPTVADAVIAKGDRIVKGLSDATTPPDDAYTVMAFADNRKGSRNVWHWKVICA